jgi:hypothetical protein
LKKRSPPRDAGGKPALRRQRIRRAHDDVATEGQQDTEARGVPSNVPPAPPRPVPAPRRSGR